jgi:hypothetical protein
LSTLKKAIEGSAKLGRIPMQNQRLFHLGREFKTGGRSLEALGIGRFGVNVVHVHSTAPPGQQAAGEDDDDVDVEDEDSDDVVEVMEATVPAPARTCNGRKDTPSEVVDLADDSDDDDDDECVVVEEVPPSKRSRR